jgi:hypothetical protein
MRETTRIGNCTNNQNFVTRTTQGHHCRIQTHPYSKPPLRLPTIGGEPQRRVVQTPRSPGYTRQPPADQKRSATSFVLLPTTTTYRTVVANPSKAALSTHIHPQKRRSGDWRPPPSATRQPRAPLPQTSHTASVKESKGGAFKKVAEGGRPALLQRSSGSHPKIS